MARGTGPERYPVHGDVLVARLLRGEVEDGETANELLAEFHRGYQICKLRLLLRASAQEAVAAGIWVASELGAEARPLLNDIVELIHHPFSHVRFFALDCVLSCAQPEDEQAVRSALSLVEDPEPSVRWKALVFLATAPEALLRSARLATAIHDPNSARARGLELLASTASCELETITALLADNDLVVRSYAAAAAARLAHRDPGPLKQAMSSEDVTIRQFAEDMAKRGGIAPGSQP